MNGQPFNLIRVHSLPVTVSKSRKAVWVGKLDPDHPGLNGLGRLAGEEPRLVVLGSWWNPPITEEGLAEIKGHGLWRYVHDNTPEGESDGNYVEGHSGCVLKTHFRHKCDRVLLVQNCRLVNDAEEGETPVWRIVPGPRQWYKPGGAKSNPSGAGASVRPWTGPAGDIAGWVGSRYADFAPHCISRHASAHIRNEVAAGLLEEAATLGALPAAWGLGDPPAPLCKVDFKQPKDWHDGGMEYGKWDDGEFRAETAAEARAWVENHKPDHILFWQECGDGDSDSDELGNKAIDLFDMDSNAANLVAEHVAPGMAFDAMFYVETYKLRYYTRSSYAGDWTKAGEGLLVIDEVLPGVTRSSPYTGGTLDGDTQWQLIGGGWENWSAAIRVIKSLPPVGAEEGGE